MLITFQIILFILIGITLMGMIGEQGDTKLRQNLTAVCIASILATVVTFII